MAGLSGGGLPANLAGVGAQGATPPANLDEMLRYRDLVAKLKAVGIEAPGVVNGITPGDPDPLSGSIKTVFAVTILPADGAAYPATITQSMLQAQLDDLSVGDAIGVRYDPDEPTAAIIYSW